MTDEQRDAPDGIVATFEAVVVSIRSMQGTIIAQTALLAALTHELVDEGAIDPESLRANLAARESALRESSEDAADQLAALAQGLLEA